MQVWMKYPNGEVFDPALVVGIGGMLIGGSNPQEFQYTLIGVGGVVLYTSTATFPDVPTAQLAAIEASVVTLT
jgi:hypothetical protein